MSLDFIQVIHLQHLKKRILQSFLGIQSKILTQFTINLDLIKTQLDKRSYE